jgi:hypothetical protein
LILERDQRNCAVHVAILTSYYHTLLFSLRIRDKFSQRLLLVGFIRILVERVVVGVMVSELVMMEIELA